MTGSTTTEDGRSRDYEWGDPDALTRAMAAGYSGMNLLERIRDRRLPLPPALRTLGIELVSAIPGRVVFALDPQEYHTDPMGLVQGGMLVALLDTAMGCAVLSHLGPATGCVTRELSTQFLHAVSPATGPIVCTGTAGRPWKRTVLSSATIQDLHGLVSASATSTCVVQAL